MKNLFKNKNVLIVGFGKSGKACLNLLLKQGAFCYIFDKDKKKFDGFLDFSKFSIVPYIDEEIVKIMDFMVLSPGISIFDECVKLAKLFGVRVIGELELGCLFVKGNVIGVTGTNGKTTTCSLVYHILKIAKKSSVLCGNIGDAITANLLPFKTNYVVEMSSFQLESAKALKTKISAITNITPNHIDRHINLKNYVDAKFNIFKNMARRGVAIFNFDDALIQKKLQDENVKKSIKAKIVYVSTKKQINGYCLKNDNIYFKHKNKTKKIVSTNNVKLVGKHNLQNILLAVAICKCLKIKNKAIQEGIDTFLPLKHRLQFVKNVNGVDYVNDSKSTSVDSTITAINAFKKKPVILLLGGSDKRTHFDLLAKKIKTCSNIRSIVVCGETSKKIVVALKKYGIKNYSVCFDFFDGLKVATGLAKLGDTILLSPACASFDRFKSFEERGECFIQYVNSIKESTEKE